MVRKTILYRGSLKSCNYRCSYCPFSKCQTSVREQDKDKKEWFRFCTSLKERVQSLGAFALMVVPYGEALIHPWYWQGLGELSAIESMEAVGAQTNLSFDLKASLRYFEDAGGKKEKLRLWATFHPEMISAEAFAEKCKLVCDAGIELCAGAVGVPENIPLLKKLRAFLPKSVYLWINRMDGLKRSYTLEEEQAFLSLDPFFCRELSVIHGQKERCQNRLFIEAGGRMRTCNISPFLPGNWYQEEASQLSFAFPSVKCNRKICSCYLAYAGRDDVVNYLLFGDYPLFRIPRFCAAAFIDIDGTLLHKEEKRISSLTTVSLKALAENGTRLFFATSLPLPEAHRKCREIWQLFEGGVFAGGAHIVYEKSILKEQVYPLEETVLAAVEELKDQISFRLSVYRRRGILYKITLSRPGNRIWEEKEVKILNHHFSPQIRASIRLLREEHCLQIIAAETGKERGVLKICQKLGISPSEAIAIGDSKEDEAMMALCGGCE